MELRGAKALVTGAAVRVGREIALSLARAGAAIHLHYHSSADEAERTAAEIRALGVDVRLVRGDLGRPEELDRVAAACLDADVLVNSAASFPRTPLPTITVEEYDEVMALNLRAPFFLSRAIGLAMRGRGRGVIVNVADYSAWRPFRAYLAYGVSKAGLVALTTGLARILAPEVRVNAVAPGPVLPPAGMEEAERRKLHGRTPLGREGSPADVANAVRFLVEGSDFVTGAVLTVDGGRFIA